MNIYSVRSSCRDTGKSYDRHRMDNVVADDLMDAAAHVQAKRPGAHIWTVAHKGHLSPAMITEKSLEEIGDSE